MISISVIISTYKHNILLQRTIQSLQNQCFSEFEIIVVDNAADPLLEEEISSLNENFSIKVQYIPEPKLGLHNARHAGARNAKGEILVFTDDDATFDNGWLRSYYDAFKKNPNMSAAGGAVKPVWEKDPPLWLLNYIGDSKVFPILAIMEPFDVFHLGTGAFFFGVNMAIGRNALFDDGGFNPELVGSVTVGNGETGLYKKLLEKQYLIGYVPEALVYHHIPSSRMTINYIRKWGAHYAGSEMYEKWFNRSRNVYEVLKEVLYIFSLYWLSWILYPFALYLRNPLSIRIQFKASLGVYKLKYLHLAYTDPLLQNILDTKIPYLQ